MTKLDQIAQAIAFETAQREFLATNTVTMVAMKAPRRTKAAFKSGSYVPAALPVTFSRGR